MPEHGSIRNHRAALPFTQGGKTEAMMLKNEIAPALLAAALSLAIGPALAQYSGDIAATQDMPRRPRHRHRPRHKAPSGRA